MDKILYEKILCGAIYLSIYFWTQRQQKSTRYVKDKDKKRKIIFTWDLGPYVFFTCDHFHDIIYATVVVFFLKRNNCSFCLSDITRAENAWDNRSRSPAQVFFFKVLTNTHLCGNCNFFAVTILTNMPISIKKIYNNNVFRLNIFF